MGWKIALPKTRPWKILKQWSKITISKLIENWKFFAISLDYFGFFVGIFYWINLDSFGSTFLLDKFEMIFCWIILIYFGILFGFLWASASLLQTPANRKPKNLSKLSKNMEFPRKFPTKLGFPWKISWFVYFREADIFWEHFVLFWNILGYFCTFWNFFFVIFRILLYFWTILDN